MYVPELMNDVLNSVIDPSPVFDFETDLDNVVRRTPRTSSSRRPRPARPIPRSERFATDAQEIWSLHAAALHAGPAGRNRTNDSRYRDGWLGSDQGGLVDRLPGGWDPDGFPE